MKREKIKSLAEYIELISKSEFQDSYFRGENDKYDKISSSLIRNIDNINDFIGVEEVYDNLQNAYYQEIGYQLDKTQEENFLAFSQHHGLKTNLIDFTTAPLVALYFACEREIYNAATGFVYILKKKNTIDASDFLHKYSIKGHTQEIKKDIPFPQIPYLMYKTPLKFDRIQNQNGVFLYQGFLDYQKDLYGEEIGTMVQEIKPDIMWKFIIKKR